MPGEYDWAFRVAFGIYGGGILIVGLLIGAFIMWIMS